jgi:vacuolar-type H+-ATPase subunit E/Vma4
MALEAILAAIRAAGDSEVQAVEKAARKTAEELLLAGQHQAELIRLAVQAEVVRPAYHERARILHRTGLESLSSIGAVHEEAIGAVFDRARRQLAESRTSPAYPALLRRLTVEALDELARSGEDVSRARLTADPRDRTLLERIVGEVGLALPVEYSLTSWGGLIAATEDEAVVVINTLESRLERAGPYLRHYLAALFEQRGALRLNTTMATPA